ncbi:DUF1801 domain-containing protein [Pseudoxanthomonas suwonensis]|uniref:YdhG-like domain-containing protein n=1 Tax=Pseudoxanthomonas suwonensis TaxID=314722 RepID=A0A0E3Z3F7_9GAMM|nr:DUF1801 domain-containing protein [Pseudoxanthomonas suwonensis]AKC88037.1 hypothetical protein WQ53_15940 [Pseudoxanthomonas suwonensis]
MAEPKTRPTDVPLETLLAGIDEPRRSEARQLAAMMQEATGEPPLVWGGDIVGFGQYAQRYADGRQLPWPLLGFSPRGRELSLYLMDGFSQRQELLARLGRHRTGKSCLYLRRLSDASPEVLRELLHASVAALEPQRIR